LGFIHLKPVEGTETFSSCLTVKLRLSFIHLKPVEGTETINGTVSVIYIDMLHSP